MEQPATAPERTIWHSMVGELGPMTERAFLKRWGKPITFSSQRVALENGQSTMHYGFHFIKPGLMPCALEREWFAAFVTGYQAAFNLMLAMLDPADRGEPS